MACGKLKSLYCMAEEILDRFHCVFIAIYLGDKGKHYFRIHTTDNSLHFVCVAINATKFPKGLFPLDNMKHSNKKNNVF